MSTTKTTQENMTPDEALERLKAGNKRFTSGKLAERNYAAEIKETAESQFPFAAILGCIDSRASAEQLFDQGIGDLFNARVAGNTVNPEVLGSLEFACHVIGSKLILVMGHTSCGAITSAANRVELGNITAMLSHITPVVLAAGPDAAFDDIAELNVLRSMERIREESPILAEMEKNGQIRIAGAMYDVATGEVRFL